MYMGQPIASGDRKNVWEQGTTAMSTKVSSAIALHVKDGAKIGCANLRVRVEQGAAPLFSMVPHRNPGTLKWGVRGDIHVGSQAALTDVLVLGMEEEATAATAQRAIVGLCLPENVEKWFAQQPGVEGKWLFLQREEGQTVWDFVNHTCGDKLALVRNDAGGFDGLIEPYGCLCRKGHWTNGQYLEALVNWLKSQTSSIGGWAIFHDATKPVRLVTYCDAR